jgi:hypothetical protein
MVWVMKTFLSQGGAHHTKEVIHITLVQSGWEIHTRTSCGCINMQKQYHESTSKGSGRDISTRRAIREMHQTFDKHFPTFDFPEDGLTPFALAMPEEYQSEDPVKAYRDYYKADKSYFAKWDKGAPAPDWWQGVTA